LASKPFVARTDNIALKYLQTTPHLTGRLGRWYILLSGYSFTVQHIPGKTNVVADTLRLVPLPSVETGLEDSLDEMLSVNAVVQRTEKLQRSTTAQNKAAQSTVWEVSVETNESAGKSNGVAGDKSAEAPPSVVQPAEGSKTVLAAYDVPGLQRACPECPPLIDYITKGLLPSDDTEARKIVYQSERFCMAGNVLYHLDLPRRAQAIGSDFVRRQLAVPRSLRQTLLSAYHDHRCHIGPEKNVLDYTIKVLLDKFILRRFHVVPYV